MGFVAEELNWCQLLFSKSNKTHLPCLCYKRTIYQLKVDVDMLNAVKSVLAEVSSVSLGAERGLWVRREFI